MDWSIRYADEIINQGDNVDITPSIKAIINLNEWTHYYTLYQSQNRDHQREGYAIWKSIIHTNNPLIGDSNKYTRLFKILLSWLILKQLEPDRTYELRSKMMIWNVPERDISVYVQFPFLRSGLKVILPNEPYEEMSIDHLVNASKLICESKHLLYIMKHLPPQNINSLINELTLYLKKDKHRDDVIDLIKKMLNPNSNFYRIALNSIIWNESDHSQATKIITRNVFEIKLSRIFTALLNKEKPPGCTSIIPGIRYLNLGYKDINIR